MQSKSFGVVQPITRDSTIDQLPRGEMICESGLAKLGKSCLDDCVCCLYAFCNEERRKRHVLPQRMSSTIIQDHQV